MSASTPTSTSVEKKKHHQQPAATVTQSSSSPAAPTIQAKRKATSTPAVAASTPREGEPSTPPTEDDDVLLRAKVPKKSPSLYAFGGALTGATRTASLPAASQDAKQQTSAATESKRDAEEPTPARSSQAATALTTLGTVPGTSASSALVPLSTVTKAPPPAAAAAAATAPVSPPPAPTSAPVTFTPVYVSASDPNQVVSSSTPGSRLAFIAQGAEDKNKQILVHQPQPQSPSPPQPQAQAPATSARLMVCPACLKTSPLVSIISLPCHHVFPCRDCLMRAWYPPGCPSNAFLDRKLACPCCQKEIATITPTVPRS